MAKKPSNKSTKKNKPAAGSNIEVGNINVSGSVYGHIIVGHGNIINMSPEQQVFRSLHQLPQPPADFTGREELISQLLADFEKGKGAAITGQPIHGLVGMGGIGKTALGLVVAHQLKKDYPDAQIFLDLKGTTTPLSAMDVMRHVIRSLEPKADLSTLDEADMSAKCQSVLHGKRALLFFDNARSADQIAPLSPPETCALLVTSRWTLEVPGLQLQSVDLMSPEKAKGFLLKLCPRISEYAEELAKACGYLPLALRIAGSFLKVNKPWSLKKYLEQFKEHEALAILDKSRSQVDLSQEHPSLRATFELSYGALSEQDRKRWRVLGTFPASFDNFAVGVIWNLDPEGEEITNLLSSLLRYSLLDYDETSSRYELHNLLSDYALSQMQDDEERETRLKHASHYQDVLRTANDLYREGGEKTLTGLRLFDLEWENIRAGQGWVSQNSDDKDCLEFCNEFPNAGSMILLLRQHPRERLAWLEKAVEAARKLGNKKYEGYHLGNLGLAYYSVGEFRKAIEYHGGSLAIARETGDRLGEGMALGNLGNAYRDLGEIRKAIEFQEARLAIARGIGDRRGEGQALGNLGNAYHRLGEFHKAIEFDEQALVIQREMSDRLGEGSVLGNLGVAYTDLGEFRKAIEFQEQRLVIAREIGDRRGEGQALGNLGIAYDRLGEFHKAIEFQEQSLAIKREIGDRYGEGNALGNLGLIYANLGEFRKAIEYHKGSLAIARETGDRYGEGNSLGNLGTAYYNLGEIRKAIEFYKQCLAITDEIGDRRGKGAALGSLGSAYYNLNEYDKAEDYYRQQMTIAQELGDRNGEASAVWGLAICKKQVGDISGAREMFQKALEIFKEIENPSAATMQQMLNELEKNEE